MIARIWQGIALSAKAGKYLEYLNRCVVPACLATEGHEGLFILKEARGELTYFLLLSLWSSDEALKKLAGMKAEEMNLTPEEKGLLIAYESSARYYEAFLMDDRQPNNISLSQFIERAKDKIAEPTTEL